MLLLLHVLCVLCCAACAELLCCARNHHHPFDLVLSTLHTNKTKKKVLWTFSIYLEAVAILPQLVLVQRTQNIDNLTGNYVFLLGCVGEGGGGVGVFARGERALSRALCAAAAAPLPRDPAPLTSPQKKPTTQTHTTNQLNNHTPLPHNHTTLLNYKARTARSTSSTGSTATRRRSTTASGSVRR